MGRLVCISCGVATERAGGLAKRCLPCARKVPPRIAPAHRKRAGDMTRLVVDGVVVCKTCRAPVSVGHSGVSRLRCDACMESRHRISGLAHGLVSKAIRSGWLRPPREFRCVDCARPAEQYDHRDYGKPLQVVAVCWSCNIMRGPALGLSSAIEQA